MSVDIKSLTEQRVEALRRERRDISLDYMVQDSEFGKWGVIIYIEYDFNPMGFEFIESNTSWKRPEAVQEYNSLVEEGYCVMVYVPEAVLPQVKDMLGGAGRPNIRLHSIEESSPKAET